MNKIVMESLGVKKSIYDMCEKADKAFDRLEKECKREDYLRPQEQLKCK